MKSSKQKITFKVIIGYITLGVLVVISGYLLLSEVKTYLQTQNEDVFDRTKILKTGSLIADIYENESLARAAIQLNSQEKYDDYILKNDLLLLKIDSLNAFVSSDYQKQILDSIKLVFNNKLQNMNELKAIKLENSSETTLNNAITKLNSIDGLLGKLNINDFVENPNALNAKTKKNLIEYVELLNKYRPVDTLVTKNQKKIDSLVSVSRALLKNVQTKTLAQKTSLQNKEQELVEIDLTASKHLKNLLQTLESEVLAYDYTIQKSRNETLDRSISILISLAIVSFISVIIFSLLILNDFWKAQRYREELEIANEKTSNLLKSREQLISMVSHDLRSPLGTITGYSELLQTVKEKTKLKYYSLNIKNAATYMAKLVDDLLEFSKLEHGNISIESVAFNLKNSIQEVCLQVQPHTTKSPVTLQIDYNKNCPEIIVSDPFRIKQILFNLVENAYKFTENGTITVAVRLHEHEDKKQLHITVSDTGIGISKSQQHLIFKEFTQATNSTKSLKSGFGLGLTISKKIATLLQGDLTLTSKLNAGSTFTLSIPYTAAPDTEKQKSKPILKTVVVIDDDDTLRQLIKDILERQKVKVYDFENAQIALTALPDIAYDLILTDIQLPKMNGFHFLETLKNSDFHKNNPVIAMTGRTRLEASHYTNSGFSAVLIKPFSPETLNKTLADYFSFTSNQVTPKVTPHQTSDHYSLKNLISFLGDDKQSIEETMRNFTKDTKNNLEALEAAFIRKDLSNINQISHKMLSMFNQLEIESILPYLHYFESAKSADNVEFNSFKTHLKVLIESLENDFN
ncbi:hybrid sensor histidine kinase/response regulator [Bizionia paragorgiae]|uniref:histidine kinase n=1 Tax=Bizionia paragorgiae TaxID=283786 RepID=A0A1H3VH13_BIZPA|nr:ATP-binding protein [Bizionia paragorgiae]SDZ73412.1 Signal transduction histidine kinase [Bizionia paragorgiae]